METEYDKILKLVDQCAAKLSPDQLEGLKDLEYQFKDEPKVLKAILCVIALQYKEHSHFYSHT